MTKVLFVALLPTRYYAQTLLFLELLIRSYEVAAGGPFKIKYVIVGVISDKFN
jgi:hypothetical protein